VDLNGPSWRKSLLLSDNYNALIILGLQIRDANGGLKNWRRETLFNLPLEFVWSNGYIFQVEMTYIAYRL